MVLTGIFQVTSRKLSPRGLALLFLLLTPAVLFARADADTDGYLTVGAVQFAVSREIYSSLESFRSAVVNTLDRLEAEAALTAPGRPLNLAVFPEYISAFPGLSYLSDEETSALAADPAGSRRLTARALAMAEPEVISMWKELSRERDYAILAGSTLILDTDGNMRNRALLFSAEGELIWTQDKVFPGDPEVSLLNLKTGRIDDARSFEIDGFNFVTTICRDTYHDGWEKALPEAHLWIDIKANELPYTRAYYDEALPDRLPGSPTDAGLTVSLSGKILGFVFTGPTEFMNDSGVIAATDPYEENAVLVVSLRVG
ncbi:MAG: hypothetical protein KAJ98_13870 [Spirochaetaceae bacterium]|nr:hypothetical protein [Spirochaetaceae bacterium]